LIAETSTYRKSACFVNSLPKAVWCTCALYSTGRQKGRIAREV